MNDPFEVLDVVRATIHHSGAAGDEKDAGLPIRITAVCETCGEEVVATQSDQGKPGTFMKSGVGYLIVCRKGKHRGIVMGPSKNA